MRNLELKVRCLDASELEAVASSAFAVGAKFAGCLLQRDTYFSVQQGRLKLRQWQLEQEAVNRVYAEGLNGEILEEAPAERSGASLIAYSRPDSDGSRYSDFFKIDLEEGDTVLQALASTLGVIVSVEKRRDLLLLHSTRIHLDTVVGLGSFVELETVLASSNSEAEDAAHIEHLEVVSILGLNRQNSIAGSYSDLLLERQHGN